MACSKEPMVNSSANLLGARAMRGRKLKAREMHTNAPADLASANRKVGFHKESVLACSVGLISAHIKL